MIVRAMKRASDASYISTVSPRKRSFGTVYVLGLFLLVYGNLFRITGEIFPNAAVSPTVYATNEPAPAKTTATAPQQTLSTQVSAAAPTPAVRANVEIPKSCTSPGYTMPSALSLASTPAGLTTIIDPPTH